jgi:GT2 family glycosyltransferase
MTDISVVILNYNGRQLLEQFLGEVIRHSSPSEVIVADNGSTDSSIDYLRSSHSAVRIITIPSNLGFCGGYNIAMKEVTTPYAVLLNSDVLVTPGWLEPVLNILRLRPEVAAAQPKILSFHEKDRFEYAGAAGGFVDSLGYPFCRGRVFDNLEKDKGQYNNNQSIFWATGACLFIRTALYHKMGGLDENFFAHMEEIDLCWKLHRAGHEVMYCGDSHIYHVGGATLATGHPRKVYYNFRNGMFLVLKHMDSAELVWKLPLRLLLDWLAAIVFLPRHPQASLSVLKAHLSVLAVLGRVLHQRGQLRQQWGTRGVEPIFHGSVVWSYFVKGRKTFNELWTSSPRS